MRKKGVQKVGQKSEIKRRVENFILIYSSLAIIVPTRGVSRSGVCNCLGQINLEFQRGKVPKLTTSAGVGFGVTIAGLRPQIKHRPTAQIGQGGQIS
jgi:hypothetical protein